MSLLCACFGLLVFVGGASAYDVTLTRTTGGMANIQASTLSSAGFGSGYAQAQDGICTLAERYMTVSAERSRNLGPGSGNSNLNQDFFWQSLIDDHTLEDMLAEPYPQGPSETAKRMAEGFAAGYNKYLSDIGGAEGITDPRCADASWVRPITATDVWRRLYQATMLQGTNARVSQIATAQPPVGGGGGGAGVTPAGEPDVPGPELGSNGLAIGEDDSADGSGLVIANPHFPWVGSERFWESHIDVPGQYHVIGASLWGAPAIIHIGHNQHVGWTHTVSTNATTTSWRLQLDPADPTRYMVDGQSVPMSTTDVTVKSLEGGVLVDRTRRLYSSQYGPILSSPAWTTSTATAFLDANASNVRMVDQWLEMGQADNAHELIDSERRIQGVPWVNTIGADDRGTAFYIEYAVTPDLPNSYLDGSCNLSPTKAVSGPFDGSVGACKLGQSPGAVVPGLLPATSQPKLVRHDFVGNSNNSHWLANPSAPLVGYSRAMGGEIQNPGMRMQTGIDMVNQRMGAFNGGNPTDGLGAAQGFSLDSLQDSWTAYRSMPAERTLPGLRAICHDAIDNSGGIINGVDVSAACSILDDYNATASIDDEGGWLFNRWWASAPTTNASFWVNPWTAANPVYTPNTLNTSLSGSRTALATAVTDLTNRGIPLDASFGDVQYASRSTQIPIPGCNEGGNCYALISSNYDSGSSPKSQVSSGSSIVMFTKLSQDGPQARGLLTYSQSEDTTSPFYEDQTQSFSDDQWISLPWTPGDVDEDKLSPAVPLSDLSNEFALTVQKDGTGDGTVSSDPARIDCGATCEADFESGQTVVLSADPEAGSTFTGWAGGGCSGTADCETTIEGATTVTATFDAIPPDKHNLTVHKIGAGKVTSDVGGIDCGSSCSNALDDGTVVTLTANPDPGSGFTGWSGGGCSGTATCQVTIGGDREVTAVFSERPAGQPSLRVARVAPKAIKVRRGKATKVKVTVRNTGGTAAKGVRVCAGLSGKIRNVRPTGCKSLGSIAAGAAKTATIKLKAKRRAGGSGKVKFTVTSTNSGIRTARTGIKVPR
ncbi:MAG: penicillin acylase family protein [Solirubrobacterales bacterium]|nr:penicillin acylase family protein [Solirubrobacterales bacterium]